MKISKTWYDILLLIILYILSTTNVLRYFTDQQMLIFITNIVLRTAFIVFALYFININLLPLPKLPKIQSHDLLFIPLLLLAFGNFLVVFIQGSTFNTEIDWLHVVQGGSIDIVVSIAEELIFRVVILGYLLKTMPALKALLYSSLIFGFMHLANISSLATILPTLIQVAYTFFFGIIAGTIFILSSNYIYVVVYHFTFNFFNRTLVSGLFTISSDFIFYAVNVGIGLVTLLYLWHLYKLFIKKGNMLYAP